MLTTDDLFLGGLALSRGGELVGVEVRGVNGRRVAVFRIAGEGLDQTERDYYGTTSVDLQLLKLQVRRLKERAFAALRQEEKTGAPGHEGRYRSDHQGQPHRRGGR